MTVRDEAHGPLDALSEDRLMGAIELLREWAEVERDERPRRYFGKTASFDGDLLSERVPKREPMHPARPLPPCAVYRRTSEIRERRRNSARRLVRR